MASKTIAPRKLLISLIVDKLDKLISLSNSFDIILFKLVRIKLMLRIFKKKNYVLPFKISLIIIISLLKLLKISFEKTTVQKNF